MSPNFLSTTFFRFTKKSVKGENSEDTDTLVTEHYARVSVGAGASLGAPSADRLGSIIDTLK